GGIHRRWRPRSLPRADRPRAPAPPARPLLPGEVARGRLRDHAADRDLRPPPRLLVPPDRAREPRPPPLAGYGSRPGPRTPAGHDPVGRRHPTDRPIALRRARHHPQRPRPRLSG